MIYNTIWIDAFTQNDGHFPDSLHIDLTELNIHFRILKAHILTDEAWHIIKQTFIVDCFCKFQHFRYRISLFELI